MCVSVTLLYCGQTSKPIQLVSGLRVAVEDGYCVLGGGYDQSEETKIFPKNEVKIATYAHKFTFVKQCAYDQDGRVCVYSRGRQDAIQ